MLGYANLRDSGLWVNLTLLFFSLFALVLFGFLVARPRKIIELQIAFYQRVNWKMEPLSWSREIRNTQLMGALSGFFGFLGFLYLGLRYLNQP